MLSLAIFNNFISRNTLSEKFNHAAVISVILLGLLFPISHAATSIASVLIVIFSLLSDQKIAVKNIIKSNYLALLFLLFYGLMIFSLIYTTADLASAMNDLGKYFRLALIPFMMALFIHQDVRDRAIKAFLIAMALTSLISYAKYFGILHFKTLSPDDVFMNRIQTGLLTAFAAYLTAHHVICKRNFNKSYFLLFLLFTTNMLFTNTGRTGLVVYCGLMALFICQTISKKNSVYLATTFIITAGFLILSSTNIRTLLIERPMQDIAKLRQGSPEVTSIGARITMAYYGLKIAAHNPIIGTGIGSHRTEYTKYNVPKFTNHLKWGDPHNQYILLFFEFGLVGLLFMLYIFYSQFRLSLQLPAQARYIAQGAVVAMIIGCFCDSLIFLGSTGMFYAYFTSMGISVQRAEYP